MNYKKHYELLINRGKNRMLSGYVERHHIIPKCMGGTDDVENLVQLTPEEHYLAHQLLIKMYPTIPGLAHAAQLMTVHQTDGRTTNKLFGWIRKKCGEDASVKMKKWHKENEHPKGMLGKKHDVNNIGNITAGIKQSALQKRVKVHAYNLDGSFYKTYSSLVECAKDLNTNASNVKYTMEGRFGHCRGKQLRASYAETIPAYVKSNTLLGKKKSTEHIENQKKSLAIKHTCIHCGHVSGKSAITRFHNDNCKHKTKE